MLFGIRLATSLLDFNVARWQGVVVYYHARAITPGHNERPQRMKALTDGIIEVQRELQVRRHVYPKLVLTGKLTAGEADRRMQALAHVLRLLERVAGGQGTSDPTTTE